ncbi:polysaccharide lyase family 8 super-sandwich domain-containing protein [Paenibacillus oryzisoli]
MQFRLKHVSSRIGNYESINAENNCGWHTSDRMTNSNLSQIN